MDAVRIKSADRHYFFNLDHAHLAAGCGGQIKIARRLAENKVAALVGFPCFHQRQVRKNSAFKDIFLPAKFFDLFAFGHKGPYARLGVKSGNACAACTHPFGKRPLRAEFNLKLTGQILPLKLFILAHIRRDHLLHLLCAQKLTDAFIVDTGIVRHKGQAGHPAVAHRIEQPFGQSAETEAAAGNQDVVFQKAIERRSRVGEKFFRHEMLQ